MKRKSNFPRKEPRVAPWLFSHSWEQRKVSEIGSFSKGTGYSKSDIRDKGTPLILYGRLYTKYETVIRDVDTFTTPKDGSVYSRGGEVIIPASGETAEDISIASVVEKSGVILGGDLNIVTPQSGIDSAFLALSISHGEAHRSLSKLAQGKSVVHIHNSDIQTVEVGIPVQAEQESISQFFEGVDRLITLHQRVQCVTGLLISWEFDRFTIFWEQRKLEEAVDVCSGCDYKSLSEGSIPVYGTGGYMLSVNKALSYTEDAVGIGRKGTIDKPYILRAPFWTVDTLFYAVPREGYDLQFVLGVFLKIDWKKKDESTGVPSLSKVTINTTEIVVPKVEEQRKIGNLLQSIDRLITLHQRKPKVLTSHQNQANKIFFAFLCDESRIRRTNSWEQRKLGELADKVTEKNSEMRYTETFTNSAESGIISQRDYFDHDISNSDNLDGYYVVAEDDFVYNPRISTTAPVGPVNRNKLNRKGVMSPLYTVFRTHDVDETYLEHFFKSDHWHAFMYLNGDSGARSDRFSIKDSVFMTMPVAYPCLAEQRQIGRLFDEIMRLITLHQREFSHTKLNINYVKYYQRIRPLLYILCSVDKSV